MALKRLSIKWKIFFIVGIGPLLVAIFLGVQRVHDIRAGAEAAIVQKSRAVILMAEAARDEMAKKLRMGLMRPLEEIPADKVLEAVPVITAINTAQVNARKAGYELTVPKIDPRNPNNRPSPLQAEVLKEMKARNLEEKVVIGDTHVYYYKAIRLTADCLYCHGEPRGAKDPTGGIKEGWKTGEIHGAFEVAYSLREANAMVAKAKLGVLGWTGAILSVIFTVAWCLVRYNVLRPLNRTRDFVGRVAEGDLTHTIDLDQADEFGEMVVRMNGMAQKLRAMVDEITRTSGDLLASSTGVNTVAESIATGAETTTGKSNTVAVAAEEMSANMNSVAAAMEEAATNVTIVATATEEMTGTIDTISRNTETAKQITEEAVAQSKSASDRVDELGKAAQAIGKVTETITNISEQTNLLALNATIEAARAGEAGKGFAVVANEIKELAKQTATATQEINQMIAGIQSSTAETVSEIEHVAKVIHTVNDTVLQISTAMDEQLQTTKEIATNVGQASQGIQEVNENVAQSSTVSQEIARDIGDVNTSANEMSGNSATLNDSAQGLLGMAQQLKQTIGRFRI
ncbi:MAG: methyl-accepting chemotaxis protein [Desulfosarcinaceae bacterium]|nr:methyl-accepting chemotaxis protein [Desulfosarcinaceae bacterium]